LKELEQEKQKGCVHKVQGKQCCGQRAADDALFCKKHIKTGIKGFSYPCLSLPTLRKSILKSDKDLSDDEQWQKYVPYDTRQLAIKELIGAFKSSLALKRGNHITSFDIGFKSKKNPRQTFHVDKGALDLGTLQIFKRRLKGQSNVRMRKRDRKKVELLKNNTKGDLVIQKDHDKWYVCVPFDVQSIATTPAQHSVFLDPGVRTFQTYYSPEGEVGKVGDEYYKEVERDLLKVDTLTSVSTKANKKTKEKIKARCSKLRTKVKNRVADLHNKTMKHLCDRFQHIYLPSFGVKGMVSTHKDEDLPKRLRNIGKKTVRAMLTLGHYTFQTKLKTYADSRGRTLTIVDESYTTKTCGRCGRVNEKVKGNKFFKCEKCLLKLDRDVHAARNICLKTLMG
jgi:putative transposase